MYKAFNTQRDDVAPQARTTSPKQPSPGLAVQSEDESKSVLFDALVTLSKTNSINLLQHGAQVAVVGELLVSVMTHLPYAMRADIANAFRDRIENLMSLSDDRCLPQSYHSALLAEVNRYLNALRQPRLSTHRPWFQRAPAGALGVAFSRRLFLPAGCGFTSLPYPAWIVHEIDRCRLDRGAPRTDTM
jgi:hypothetical protein